ncbi:uncharacterized protein LOC101855753 [Aplysia californica]|uniref:Uncharacterized protein LOC101855753 n=1 Tax=Aplysia californica TaxID=6500 RepID=A0ABM0K5F1_APLCA|nr:uncharacterized protein LOC101855753 [Aplysia californica]XP_005109165.1 uncharacterized protein LOC101855753 [Aplysia californica]
MEANDVSYNTVELPPSIEIKESIVCKGCPGAFSKILITKNTRFGPYKGEIITPDQKPFLDYRYAWEVFEKNSDDLKFTISAADPQSSNWMRNVNNARFYEEQNILSLQDGYSIFYMAMKDIRPGEELLTWFDPKLLKRTQRRLSKMERKPVGYTIELVPMEDEKKFVPEIIETKRSRKKKILSDMISLEDEGSLLARKNFNKVMKLEKELEHQPQPYSKVKRDFLSGPSSSSENTVKKDKRFKQSNGAGLGPQRMITSHSDAYKKSKEVFPGHEVIDAELAYAESEGSSMTTYSGKGRRRKVRKNLVGMKKRSPTKCRGRKPKLIASGKVDLSKDFNLADSSVKPVLIKQNTDGSISVDDHDESYTLKDIELSLECDDSCQCLDKGKAMGEQNSLHHDNRGIFIIHFILLPEHKTETEDKKIAYKCDICDSAYRHAFSLKRHYLSVHINHRYLSRDDIISCQIDSFYTGVQQSGSDGILSSQSFSKSSQEGIIDNSKELALPTLVDSVSSASQVTGGWSAPFSSEPFRNLKDKERFLLCDETLGEEEDNNREKTGFEIPSLSLLAQACLHRHHPKSKRDSTLSLECRESLTSAELLTPTAAELQSKSVFLKCVNSSDKYAAVPNFPNTKKGFLPPSSRSDITLPVLTATSSQNSGSTNGHGSPQGVYGPSASIASSVVTDSQVSAGCLSSVSLTGRADSDSVEEIHGKQEKVSTDLLTRCTVNVGSKVLIDSSSDSSKCFQSTGSDQLLGAKLVHKNESGNSKTCSSDTPAGSCEIADKTLHVNIAVDSQQMQSPISSVEFLTKGKTATICQNSKAEESACRGSVEEEDTHCVSSTTVSADSFPTETISDHTSTCLETGKTGRENVTDAESESGSIQEVSGGCRMETAESENNNVKSEAEPSPLKAIPNGTSENGVCDTVSTFSPEFRATSDAASTIAKGGPEASETLVSKSEAVTKDSKVSTVEGSVQSDVLKLEKESKTIETSKMEDSECVQSELPKKSEVTKSEASSPAVPQLISSQGTSPQQPVIFVTNIVFPIVSHAQKNLPMSLPVPVSPSSASISTAPPTTLVSQAGLPVVLISSLSRGLNVQNANALLQSPSTLKTLQSLHSSLNNVSYGQPAIAMKPDGAAGAAINSPHSTVSASASVVAVTTKPIPSVLSSYTNSASKAAAGSTVSSQDPQKSGAASDASPDLQPPSQPYDLYRCHMCVLVFQTMGELKHHIKNDPHRFKGGVKQYSCLQCSMRFAFKNNLIRHNLMYHQDDKDLKHRCLTCGKGFTTETYLKMHARFHSGKNFPCKYGCVNVVFPNAASLVKHLRTEHAGLDRQEFLKNAKAERARRKKLSRLFGLTEDEISKFAPENLTLGKAELPKWKPPNVLNITPNTVSTYSMDRPGVGFQAKRGRPKGSKNAVKLVKSEPEMPKLERQDIVSSTEVRFPAVEAPRIVVKKKLLIRFRCKICHKGFTTHMGLLQHRSSRHGADQSVQEYLYEMSKAAGEEDPTSDECEDMNFSPPPSPKSFYANVNKKGSENIRRFIDGGLEALKQWKKHIQVEDYLPWTEDLKWKWDPESHDWTRFNFPPCFELKEDYVKFYNVGESLTDVSLKPGMTNESSLPQIKQEPLTNFEGEDNQVGSDIIVRKSGEEAQGGMLSTISGDSIESECKAALDLICSSIEQQTKDVDVNSDGLKRVGNDNTLVQGSSDGVKDQKATCALLHESSSVSIVSGASESGINPLLPQSDEMCKKESRTDLSAMELETGQQDATVLSVNTSNGEGGGVVKSDENRQTLETTSLSWMANVCCDSASLSSAADSGVGSLSSSASGSLSSCDALLTTVCGRTEDQSVSVGTNNAKDSTSRCDSVKTNEGKTGCSVTEAHETTSRHSGSVTTNNAMTPTKPNLTLLRELKVKEMYQILSSAHIQALCLELGTCALNSSRGHKTSTSLPLEALNLCSKDNDTHKEKHINFPDLRAFTEVSRRVRRSCSFSSAGHGSPHKRSRRSLDQSPELQLNNPDSTRHHEHRRYSIWSGTSQHKSHGPSVGVHCCPVVERVKKQESMRRAREYENNKSRRIAESLPKLHERDKDKSAFLELSGLVRRQEYELSPHARGKEQHCITPPEIWDIYQKIWFGKKGAITVVCSICHRHFSCLELCLRHQLKKHPHIEPHSLEMEKDNYVEDMFYYYPTPYGILAKSQLIPDNMPAPEIYVCTRCTFPFKNLSRLHAHMIVCDPAHDEVAQGLGHPKPSFMKGKLLPMMDRRLNQDSVPPPRPKLGRPLKNKHPTATVSRAISDEGKNATAYVQRSNSVPSVPYEKEAQAQKSTARSTLARSQSSLYFPVKKRKNYEMMYNPKKHVRRRELYQVLEQHQCHGCNLKFNSLPMLERHVKKCSGRDKLQSQKPLLSGIIPDDAAVRKQHTCRYCNKRFTYIKGVDLHYKRVCAVRKLREEENKLTAEDLAHEDELQRIIEHMKWSKTLNKDSSDIIQGHVRVEEDGTLTRVVKKRGWPRGLKKKVKKKGYKWTTLKRHRSDEELQNDDEKPAITLDEPQKEDTDNSTRRTRKQNSSGSKETAKQDGSKSNRSIAQDDATSSRIGKPNLRSVSASSDKKTTAQSKEPEVVKPVAKRGRPRKKPLPQTEVPVTTKLARTKSPVNRAAKLIPEKTNVKKAVKVPVIPEVVKPPPRKRGRPKKFDPSDMESSYKKKRKSDPGYVPSKKDLKSGRETDVASPTAAQSEQDSNEVGDQKWSENSPPARSGEKGKMSIADASGSSTNIKGKPVSVSSKDLGKQKGDGDERGEDVEEVLASSDRQGSCGSFSQKVGSGSGCKQTPLSARSKSQTGASGSSCSQSELFKHLTDVEEGKGKGKSLVSIESSKDGLSRISKEREKSKSFSTDKQRMDRPFKSKSPPTVTPMNKGLVNKFKSTPMNVIQQKNSVSKLRDVPTSLSKGKISHSEVSDKVGKVAMASHLNQSALSHIKKRPSADPCGGTMTKKKQDVHTVPVFKSIPKFPSTSTSKPSLSKSPTSLSSMDNGASSPASASTLKASIPSRTSPVKTLSAKPSPSPLPTVVNKPPVSVRVVTLSPNGNNLLTYDEIPKVSVTSQQPLTSPDKLSSPNKLMTPILTTLPKGRVQTSGSSVIQAVSQMPQKVTVGPKPPMSTLNKVPLSCIGLQQQQGATLNPHNKLLKPADGMSTFVTVSSSTKGGLTQISDQPLGLGGKPIVTQPGQESAVVQGSELTKAAVGTGTQMAAVTSLPVVTVAMGGQSPGTISRLAVPPGANSTGKLARGTIVPGVISSSMIQSGTRVVKVGNVLTTSPIRGNQPQLDMNPAGPRLPASRFIPAVVTPKPIIVSTSQPMRKVSPQMVRLPRAVVPQTMAKVSVVPQGVVQRHLVYQPQGHAGISVGASAGAATLLAQQPANVQTCNNPAEQTQPQSGVSKILTLSGQTRPTTFQPTNQDRPGGMTSTSTNMHHGITSSGVLTILPQGAGNNQKLVALSTEPAAAASAKTAATVSPQQAAVPGKQIMFSLEDGTTGMLDPDSLVQFLSMAPSLSQSGLEAVNQGPQAAAAGVVLSPEHRMVNMSQIQPPRQLEEITWPQQGSVDLTDLPDSTCDL